MAFQAATEFVENLPISWLAQASEVADAAETNLNDVNRSSQGTLSGFPPQGFGVASAMDWSRYFIQRFNSHCSRI